MNNALRSLLLLTAIVTITHQALGQSLADVARRERARQGQTHARMTITTEQIRAVDPTAPPAPPESAAAKQPGAATAPAEAKGEVKDEKYWRKAFADARDGLKRAEDRVKLLELKLNDLNSQLLTRSDIYGREQTLLPEITKTQNELETARVEIEKAKAKITGLEEELRKSGGLPGWAR